jgi:transcriptional regulator with XRE-family HTH domain
MSRKGDKQTSTMSAREALALNLVILRRHQHWSQEKLALEAHLHRTFVAHVERGARNISLDNIEKLATALGVQAYLLLQPPDQRAVSATKPAEASLQASNKGA